MGPRDALTVLRHKGADWVVEKAPSAVRRWVPPAVLRGPPIAQVYIAGAGWDTLLWVNNFYTLLLPSETSRIQYDIRLSDEHGRIVARHQMELGPHASASVSVAGLLGALADNGPRTGLAIVRAAPSGAGSRSQRGLGRTAPHFFTHYQNLNHGISTVHAQSPLNQRAGPNEAWWSTQEIDTDGLAALWLLQANHSMGPVTVNYDLQTLESTGEAGPRLAAFATEVPERAGRLVQLTLPSNPPSFLRLAVSRLPSPNGKPLVLKQFRDGRWSMCHA